MSILSGALTVRRFRVDGDLPDDFRERYRDSLNQLAFREPPNERGKEEVEGWVQIHNLLDNEFDDFNQWLYDGYAVFALRVDKKTLPAKLFSATLAKKCDAWAQENGMERCPASVRTTLKDDLEDEWLRRTLPRAAVTEACWNLNAGWVVLHSHSDGVADRFRKRFYRTFGLPLLPWSPLDWLDDGAVAEKLMGTSPSFGPDNGGAA